MTALPKWSIPIFLLLTAFEFAMAQREAEIPLFRPQSNVLKWPEKTAQVSCTYLGKDGGLWIGYYGAGLSTIDPSTGKSTRYQYRDDDANTLLDNDVVAIVNDNYGHIWVTTSKGLNCIRRDPRTNGFIVEHYAYDNRSAQSLHHAFSTSEWELEAKPGMVGQLSGWEYLLNVLLVISGVYAVYLLWKKVRQFKFVGALGRKGSDTVKDGWRMPLQSLRKDPKHGCTLGDMTGEYYRLYAETALCIPKEGFLGKAWAAVEDHLDDPEFDVRKLCRTLAISHSQLHRKLSAQTGLSAIYFIRYVRLNKARELLQNPAQSINSIAFDSGFSDPAYFCRVFKQEFGLTPQKWRDYLPTG